MHNSITRKLTATWTIDEVDVFPVRLTPAEISELSEEEQADLIIDKLTNPPVKKTLMEEIADRIADQMAADIDKAVMDELMGNLDDV